MAVNEFEKDYSTIREEGSDEQVRVGKHLHEAPNKTEPTTTIHISKSTFDQIDSVYKLAGYDTKLEFYDEAILTFLESQKVRLKKAGIDVDKISAMLKKL